MSTRLGTFIVTVVLIVLYLTLSVPVYRWAGDLGRRIGERDAAYLSAFE